MSHLFLTRDYSLNAILVHLFALSLVIFTLKSPSHLLLGLGDITTWLGLSKETEQHRV